MNPEGHSRTLVASHPGNQNATRRGIYSRTGAALEPRVQELTEAIMAEPHTTEIDRLGATELAKLIALLEAIDAELAERGLTRKSGEPRGLVDLRLRASRRLAEWLDRYGATPLARATWARQLAEGGLAAEIARRREGRAE